MCILLDLSKREKSMFYMFESARVPYNLVTKTVGNMATLKSDFAYDN